MSESHKIQKTTTKNRAQLKHVLLDVSFKDKPKILDLEIEFKPIARLLLMDILAACSAASDAEISVNVCLHLANRIGISAETAHEIIKYCIKNEILQSNGDKITNSRVIKDQESYFKKLESDRKRKESKRIPIGNHRDPDIDIDNDIDLNIKNNSQAPEQLETYDLPAATCAAIDAWAAHQKKKSRHFDQEALNGLIKSYSGKIEELPRDIYHSISNNWKGVFPAPKSIEPRKKPDTASKVNSIIDNLRQKGAL